MHQQKRYNQAVFLSLWKLNVLEQQWGILFSHDLWHSCVSTVHNGEIKSYYKVLENFKHLLLIDNMKLSLKEVFNELGSGSSFLMTTARGSFLLIFFFSYFGLVLCGLNVESILGWWVGGLCGWPKEWQEDGGGGGGWPTQRGFQAYSKPLRLEALFFVTSLLGHNTNANEELLKN